MADSENIRQDFFHLARIALSERTQDVHVLLHRIAKRKSTDPETAAELIELLRKNQTRMSPLRRKTEMSVPIDIDSRFQLIRIEEVPILPYEPTYVDVVQDVLDQLIAERINASQLLDAHLEPTRTVLFTGPPGVGKTLAAKWLARELKLPLLTLDLSAVMSSYLGRTGVNVRHVLDYAKSIDCVLLLDELDTIAKRRDDLGEIGELKRLVTVLLQQLDEWPSTGLLIAATNHSDLLDPAIWRRFEQLINFPLPDKDTVETFLFQMLQNIAPEYVNWSEALSISLAEQSFAEIERKVKLARRATLLNKTKLSEYFPSLLCVEGKSKRARIDLATCLVAANLVSQRQAQKLTGVARETIRSRLKANENYTENS